MTEKKNNARNHSINAPRRIFLTKASMLAGLSVCGAGAAGIAFAQGRGSDPSLFGGALAAGGQAAKQKVDPHQAVLEFSAKESAKIIKAIQRGGPRAEHGHALATQIRLLNSTITPDLDALGPQIAARTDIATFRPHDMRPELKAKLGVEIANLPDPARLTQVQIQEGLLVLQRGGMTPLLAQLADRIDVDAAKFADLGNPHIRLAQSGTCGRIQSVTEVVTQVICAASWWMPEVGGWVCLAYTVMYVSAVVWNWYTGGC